MSETQHIIRPVRKAIGDDDQPFLDASTLNITCVYSLDSMSKQTKDLACLEIGKNIIDQIKGTAPDVEIAVYPEGTGEGQAVPQPTIDPDYPGDPMVSIFRSITDADVFLFKTCTSPYGVATAASAFFDRFNDMVKRDYDGIMPESGRVAGVVVIGGQGAYDLAACILCNLSDIGFTIPAHAAVVYEDGTGSIKGDKATARSSAVSMQVTRMTTGVIRLAKKLKTQ